MTDDLVKRLRKRTDPFKMVTTVPIQESPDWICQEAADCIEKFDAALVRTFDKMMEDGKRIETLEAALRVIAALGYWDGDSAMSIAHKALEENNDHA